MRNEAQIGAVLSEGRDATIATVMADGGPHATTVSYASAGPKLYFGCSSRSLKAANLARDDRVAVTVTLPYRDWAEIRGLSARGRVRRLTSEDDIGRVGLLFMEKFSEVAQYIATGDADLALFEVSFDAVGLLDYRQGFGHVEHFDA